jgi:gas vesicle protein
MGAGAAWYLRSKMGEGVSEEDAVMAGITGGGAKETRSFVDRLNKIGVRLKALATRTRDTLQSATETLGPVVQQAVKEARHTAEEIEEDLKSEIDKAQATAEAEAKASAAAPAAAQSPG